MPAMQQKNSPKPIARDRQKSTSKPRTTFQGQLAPHAMAKYGHPVHETLMGARKLTLPPGSPRLEAP